MSLTAARAEPAAALRDASSLSPRGWAFPAAVGCIAAAHLPLLTAYYGKLWGLPHYQFFPLAWVGAFLLWRRQQSETYVSTPTRSWLPSVVLALGMSLLTAAVVVDSPWLANLAALTN